jgi:hypothetical protein
MSGGEPLGSESKMTFFSHVFSGSEESKAEILNVIQYSSMAVIPVVVLNKLIQRFIPEAEVDKSSLELLAEIFIQLIVMFCGIIIIHRMITYFPTYSGFKYESLTLTNVIVAFLIIVLSIQTKMGIKVSLLAEQVMDLWNGSSSSEKPDAKKNMRKREPMSGGGHTSSQADYLQDNTGTSQMTVFPPLPTMTSNKPSDSYNYMTPSQVNGNDYGSMDMGPQPSNFMGNVFGSAF